MDRKRRTAVFGREAADRFHQRRIENRRGQIERNDFFGLACEKPAQQIDSLIETGHAQLAPLLDGCDTEMLAALRT